MYPDHVAASRRMGAGRSTRVAFSKDSPALQGAPGGMLAAIAAMVLMRALLELGWSEAVLLGTVGTRAVMQRC